MTTLVGAFPQSPTGNGAGALIGGIVGGVVGLLLLIGIVAFFVVRNRRANTNADANKAQNDAALPSAGDYGRIQISHRTSEYAYAPNVTGSTVVPNYDDVSDVREAKHDE